MTMIEKVAKAICIAYDIDPDWGNPPFWKNHIDSAKAALEAMMEPTEEMFEIFRKQGGIDGYQAMIKAALNGK